LDFGEKRNGKPYVKYGLPLCSLRFFLQAGRFYGREAPYSAPTGEEAPGRAHNTRKGCISAPYGKKRFG